VSIEHQEGPTIVHQSDGPCSFEEACQYMAYLKSLVDQDLVASICSFRWEQGEPIRADVTVKYAPEMITIKLRGES
jgi:hypothetical protein